MRSMLFVPGNRPDMMIKSFNTEADALIFDLEDAVPSEEKQKARAEINKVLESHHNKEVFIRINSFDTPWIIDDILAVSQCPIRGVVIPKVNSASELEKVSWFMSYCENRNAIQKESLTVIPIIETPKGINNIGSIVNACSRIEGVMFGAIDYLLSINGSIEQTDTCLIYPRSAVVNACREKGVSPIDTVYPNYKDNEGLVRECNKAKAMGFSGKACIHPSQIATINDAFLPLPHEIEWAKRVIAAYDEAVKNGKGSVALNGEMVDLPVAEKAKKILALIK